jgi:hypothetical protein
MYTSYIGKKFLTAWNEREGMSLTAKEFFDSVLFPLFFDDERHLMHVSNSPFFQQISAEDKKSGLPEAEIRRNNLHHNVNSKAPNASFYIGYGAEKSSATTSGQITTMPGEITPEEIYSSWIGEGLAWGVAGGYYILSDQIELMFICFDGWKYYREYISQTPNLKGRQIETWNGQWLTHRLMGGQVWDFDLKPEGRVVGSAKESVAIPGIKWTELVLALCRKYPKENLTIYAYNLSQTNTTLGFILLKLQQIHTLFEVRDKYFLDQADSVLSDSQITKLEPFFKFNTACAMGVIGLRAIEPSKLRNYLPQYDPKKNKDLKITDDQSYSQFTLFKLWIYAMLNKSELLQFSAKIAHMLRISETSQSNKLASRGKSSASQLTDEIRSATNIRQFIEKLTVLIDNYPDAATIELHNVISDLVKMPADQFPLFVTLVRFEYSYQSVTSNQ